ncbi:unnamed protein product [Effrenium voratum]|uniref:Carrier domain-containing protein n=1 Tax=Effrenium voratum TaxID=2562239 RepID=A0AA36NI55_9DINO|nr:unnamed protein product [Effrenium voratum]
MAAVRGKKTAGAGMASFPAAVDAVAQEAPQSLAMEANGTKLSYAELASRSRQAARGLLELGVQRCQRPVLTSMQRGCDWYIVYVAASRLGAPLAALAREPHVASGSAVRCKQFLQLRPQLAVVDHADLQIEDVPSYRLGDLMRESSQEIPEVCPDDVLCYCFTGGTTGRQRLVPCAQAMALHELRRYPAALHWEGGCSTQARVLQPSSLQWAAAVFGQLDVALALRGCAVVSEDLDVKDLAATVRHHKVSIVGLPPSMLALLSPVDFIDTRTQGGYSYLRRLISWGEPCPAAVAELWGAPNLPWRFLDVLISTEYWLSFVSYEREDGRSLFKPVPDVEVFLRPMGEDCHHAELCISGPGVCRTLGAEAEAFVEHQRQTFYRSGDLAQWQKDGLVFAGRGDELVKVFGRWVDLSDVARQLSALPGALEAATVTAEEHHAAVVMAPGWDADALEAAATRVLPSGGVRLHLLEEPLPRKQDTRKVDRFQLLQYLRQRSSRADHGSRRAECKEPRSDQALLDAISEVLGRSEPAAPSRSFASLGGDSVAALRAAARARSRGLDVSALDLLSAPSISAVQSKVLAEHPAKRPRASSSKELTVATQQELGDEFTDQVGLPWRAAESTWLCTPFQDLLLFALEAGQGQAARATPGTLQSCALLGHAVSVRGLRAAWFGVQQRCAALRSCFLRVRGQHIQVVLRPSWSKVEMRIAREACDGQGLKQRLKRWMREDLLLSFRSSEPLCRLCLLQANGTQRTALLLSVHNAICDGWSANLLLQDILSLSIGLEAPTRPAQVPDPQADGGWWQRTLEGFRPTPQAAAAVSLSSQRRLAVAWEGLRLRSAAWQVTPAALLLAAWCLVWSRSFGCRDLVFGAVLSGREAVADGFVGCAVSLLPLRLRLTDSWQTLLSFTAEVQRCLVAHAAMCPAASLTQIRQWCDLPSEQPLFDCAWIFDQTPPLPDDLVERTKFELVSEFEVPAAGDGAQSPELRITRRGESLDVSLRGRANGQQGDGALLLSELEAVLALLMEASQHTVEHLLQVVPLLPCWTSSLPAQTDVEELAAFWGQRLLGHEATALPHPLQGGRGGWQSVPVLLPPESREAILAAWASSLGKISGQNVVSVAVPLAATSPGLAAGQPVGWFPLGCRGPLADMEQDLSRQILEMAPLAQAPRYVLERLLRLPSWTPSAAFFELAGVSLDSSELQQWGETAGRWRSLQHKDLAGAELVLVLGRSSSSKLPGLVLWNEASGMSKDMVHILRRRLCATLRARAVPDRVRQLHELGAAASPPLHRAGLVALLRQQAQRTPQATALHAPRCRLSYSQLLSCAATTAERLRACCAPVTVGVLAERSPAAVVGLLGSLLAGSAYCPLIPSHPVERLATMLSIAALSAVLFHPELQILAETLCKDIPPVCIRLDSSTCRTMRAATELPLFSRDGPAGEAMHVLFTSGSTGTPKAVRASEQVGLQHTSLAWVAAAPELWAPLLVGARLVLPPGAKDLETLAKYGQRCTLQQYVPSVLQAMLHANLMPISNACRQLVLTGEPLATELCRRVQRHGLQLRNHYGQTEAADTTTVHVFRGLPVTSVPLGRAATQRQVWLRAQVTGESVCGVGEPGELMVGGPGLHLSRELEESPLGAGAQLPSGDLARWVPLGASLELMCLGRKDRQVKVRGHRIELAEIEAVLQSEAEKLLGKPLEALVTFAAQRLVAYVRPPLSTGDAHELHNACGKRLLAHAMPQEVIGVVSWPRTVTGKLDRQALPQPQPEAPAKDSRPAAPQAASRYLARAPPAPPHQLQQKGWQLLYCLLAGALCSRFSMWRMLLLPLVWTSWQQLLASRSSPSLFAQHLSSRVPLLSTSLLLALLPGRLFGLAAAFGGWRLGLRGLAQPVLWWLGASCMEGQLRQEFHWYGWYLHPTRCVQLAGMIARGCKDILGAAARGQMPPKRPADWDWDAPERRPRRRPRLDYVWVEPKSEPVASADRADRSGMSQMQLELLERLEEEAGRPLEPRLALASAFDSLRLTALVGALRRSCAPLTLREALACDTVADFIRLLADAKTSTCDDNARSTSQIAEPQVFRVREWPYMFSLSVCWALETHDHVDMAALQRALRCLVMKHGALTMQLADPPASWDFAMEAASNLSLARSLLRRHFGVIGANARRHPALKVLDFVGWLLWVAWPQLRPEQAEEVPLDVISCENQEQLEWRSAWLLDGRNARSFLVHPIHAVLLTDTGRTISRLHLAVSHGLADGFSGLPLLQDFLRFYQEELKPEKSADRFSGLVTQEARLQRALAPDCKELDVADISSWALPGTTVEGFDHFVWLQPPSMKTLQSIVEQRCWCCSLDVALLAVLGCALWRLHPETGLHLRFVASARDQGDEGSIIADLADARDLDFAFDDQTTVEEAARSIAHCVRHRRWVVPDPLVGSEGRVYINVRPLLDLRGREPEGSEGWRHITQWPPVKGERNWDRRNVYHALWIMADQVSSLEWVLCLKVRKDKPEDAKLGPLLQEVLDDMVLRPNCALQKNDLLRLAFSHPCSSNVWEVSRSSSAARASNLK